MFARIALTLTCLLFVAVTDTNAALRSRITGSTMDSYGNTFVTGWRVTEEVGTAYVSDIVTIKYDKFGSMQWTHRYPDDPKLGEISDSEAWGIAADRFGNVYVAGHTGKPGDVDCLLIKYPANYQQGEAPEWVRTVDGGIAKNDQNWAITVDPDGFIYVTGYSVQLHDGAAAGDFVTMKYDSNGTMVWGSPALYHGHRGEHAYAIAVDPVRKNVFVTGYSDTGVLISSTGTAMGADMITIMYNSAGVEQWVRRYNGKDNGYSRGTSLKVDAEGNVYVAGWSQGDTSLDIVTVKYGVDGDEMWSSRYDGPAKANDQSAPPAGFAAGAVSGFANYVQNNQGIIVTTELVDPVSTVDYLMHKVLGLQLNPGLQVSLLAKLKFSLKSLEAPNAAVRRNAHHGLEALIHELQALVNAGAVNEATGKELAAVARNASRSIQGMPSTVVYVGGQSTGDGTGVDFVLLKYNGEDGNPMWNLPGQPGTSAEKRGTPSDIALRYDGPAKNTDRGWQIALDRDGNIFLSGPSVESTATGVDFFTSKHFVNTYRPVTLAETRYKGLGAGVDQPCGFATWRDPDTAQEYIFRDPVTGEDYVGVTGNTAATPGGVPTWEFTTLMYDGNLMERWLQTYFDE